MWANTVHTTEKISTFANIFHYFFFWMKLNNHILIDSENKQYLWPKRQWYLLDCAWTYQKIPVKVVLLNLRKQTEMITRTNIDKINWLLTKSLTRIKVNVSVFVSAVDPHTRPRNLELQYLMQIYLGCWKYALRGPFFNFNSHFNYLKTKPNWSQYAELKWG